VAVPSSPPLNLPLLVAFLNIQTHAHPRTLRHPHTQTPIQTLTQKHTDSSENRNGGSHYVFFIMACTNQLNPVKIASRFDSALIPVRFFSGSIVQCPVDHHTLKNCCSCSFRGNAWMADTPNSRVDISESLESVLFLFFNREVRSTASGAVFFTGMLLSTSMKLLTGVYSGGGASISSRIPFRTCSETCFDRWAKRNSQVGNILVSDVSTFDEGDCRPRQGLLPY
jgi:hypothetical protein